MSRSSFADGLFFSRGYAVSVMLGLARHLEINQLRSVTREVVEAARDSLVIGPNI